MFKTEITNFLGIKKDCNLKILKYFFKSYLFRFTTDITHILIPPI